LWWFGSAGSASGEEAEFGFCGEGVDDAEENVPTVVGEVGEVGPVRGAGRNGRHYQCRTADQLEYFMTGSRIPGTSVFIDGAEVQGFILYGLWPGDLHSTISIGELDLRMEGATLRSFRLFGDGWTILMWDVGFDTSNAYLQALSGPEFLLDYILGLGARVAWLGAEGLPFADPPDLFTAEWMEGSVLAGKTRGGDFLSGIDLVAGHTPLDRTQMRHLEAAAKSTYEQGGR
jgi:hypothetical protein